MSIHPHSQPHTYFIFCVGQDIRKINAFKANMAYHKISIKPLLGMYKGQSEQSFIANMTNFRFIEPWLNEEESILHIHNFDARDIPDATLIFLKKGSKVELGKMRPADRELALARDAWTYDPIYGAYFVTDR